MEEKVPRIRFPGFTNPWKQCKLGELCEVLTGGEAPLEHIKSKYPDGEYKYPIYSNGLGDNALWGYSKTYRISSPAITFSSIGTLGYPEVRNACFTPIIRLKTIIPKDDLMDIRYLAHNLSTVNFSGNASGIPNINAETVKGITLFHTSNYIEQESIGKYFEVLDNLITLHQRKCEDLKTYKKGLLQKMFPKEGNNVPEIRFPGFTDPWEQCKLGSTKTFFTDGNYGESYPKASDMTDSSIGIPFLTGGNLKEGRLDVTGASYITKEKHELLTSGHLIEDDIVIAVRGSLGALGYVNKENEDWNINSQLAILRTNKTEMYGKYLLQFLLSGTGQKELIRRQTGTALKQLPIGAIKDVEIPITSIEEQKKIGDCLFDIDNLITLHQRKYDEMKEYKIGLLQQMFV